MDFFILLYFIVGNSGHWDNLKLNIVRLLSNRNVGSAVQ